MFSLSRRGASPDNAGLSGGRPAADRLTLEGLDHLLVKEATDATPAVEVEIGPVVTGVDFRPAPAVVALQARLEMTVSLLRDATEKLSSATFRLGFLESQLSQAEDKLKLLPDLESRADESEKLRDRLKDLQVQLDAARAPSWKRFSSWFFGT